MGKKVPIKRKKKCLAKSEEVLENADLEYNNPQGTSNALVLQSTKRRKQNVKSKDEVEKSINPKKIEAKKRHMAMTEAKVSKKKRKKLLNIQANKEKKETREALFASLKMYELPQSSFSDFLSSVDVHGTIKKRHDVMLPGKLNSLAGRKVILDLSRRIKSVQENYYETDSESEEDENSMLINVDDPTVSGIENSISAESTTSSSIYEAVSAIKLAGKSINEQESNNMPPIIDLLAKHSDKDIPCAISKKSFVEKMGQCEISNVSIHQVHAAQLSVGTASKPRASKYVSVERSESIEKQRSKLPIYAEEQSIIEAISENHAVIICGETGSGKTTQLPQFLYEAGYAENDKLIGITEPRRVAAISMATRVAHEMNMTKKVSYQIKYEGNRSAETRILFMTDGVLMKELQKDVTLSAYSVIIIDEGHERSMYSDVLIGVLSRISPYRCRIGDPLKVVIMSATLRLDDFLQKSLFPISPPPVIRIDARQFPVTIHFEKLTPENYLVAAYRKICRIHEELPPGSILIFLSGRLEVLTLLKWLRARYPGRSEAVNKVGRRKKGCKYWNTCKVKQCKESTEKVTFEEENEILEKSSDDRFAGIDDFDAENDDEDLKMLNDGEVRLPNVLPNVLPLHCLPLYSLLSSEQQQRVFRPAPLGQRMCVIATNVAETSLTIPSVRYVVDSGREKRRCYDPITGVSQFSVHWISQASADQRAGRAGRVQAGDVYRLYSSAVYADLEKFSPPEILTKPVDQLVLHMKSMSIVKISNFPFPTAPEVSALEEAEMRLIRLGALEITLKNILKEARITSLGKTLAAFPLAPSFAKMLVMAKQHSLLIHMCCVVSSLSVREPLIQLYSLRGKCAEDTQNLMLEALKLRRKWCGLGQARQLGDVSVLLKALFHLKLEEASEEDCLSLGLRRKAIIEAQRLCRQLMKVINSSCSLEIPLTMEMKLLKTPNNEEFRFMRQIIIASLSDNIARKVNSTGGDVEIPNGAYECQKLEGFVFIDPTSVLYKDEPEWILFHEIVERKGKKFMQCMMVVEPDWLSRLSDSYCHFKEIKDTQPRYDAKSDAVLLAQECTFGDHHWPLGEVERQMPVNINLYRQFARFFLDGSVCIQLEVFADKLLVSPLAMIKNWSQLQQRTEKLLNALIEYEVISRKRLYEIWKCRSEFLLDEYLAWLPQSCHETVQMLWPPISD